jgi:FkbH-like protein
MQSDLDRQHLRHRIKEAIDARNAADAVNSARHLLSVSNKSADVMFCASAFSAIGDALSEQLGTRKLKTYIVRSVTLEPILPALAVEAVLANYALDIKVGGYGSYVDELLNPASALVQFQPELLLIILDYEELAGCIPELCADGIGTTAEEEINERVTRMEHLLRNYRNGSTARILFQGLVVPDLTSLGDVGDANLPYSLTNSVQILNRRLAALCGSISDCIFFDVDHIAARHGRARWCDARLFLASRLPVSTEFFQNYSHGIVRSFSTLFRAPRKVLCTDLDNTLWGGVIGEDGPEGIATGSSFPGNCYLEYQRYLRQLSARGILLAIASKNNETDVREAFQIRSADIALTLDDFVAHRINWNDKSQSIREMSMELSVGLDSFVFVDNNAVECAAVRQQLPEVAVVQVPVEEPCKLVKVLAEQPFFDAPVVTKDDTNRVMEYKAQAQRNEQAASTANRDEFLTSLGIICTFQSALLAPLARTVQLLAKTNQFNLTTRRHSAAEVEKFASTTGGQAVVVRVRDRYGDAGAVGLALAQTQGDLCRIDSLLLSCRVIGRGIETALLAYLCEQAARDGAKRLIGEFIATKKNSLCAEFYPENGFKRLIASQGPSDDSIFYALNLTDFKLATPQWLTVEGF